METVAEENPLRSATSRMVAALPARRREPSDGRRELAEGDDLESAMQLEFRPLAGGHYSTMERVSRRAAALLAFALCCLSGVSGQNRAAGAGSKPAAVNPQKSFEAGEAALREGKLDDAERAFRQVLAVDPASAGAYSNLGVIQMRRKQWPHALPHLH